MHTLKQQAQKGFTLIELMIVIAIIAILAAFAIPAYQDYTKRTYVAEGLTLASSAKLAISEYFAVNGTFAGITCDDASAPIVLPGNGSINACNPALGLANANQITGQAVTSIAATVSTQGAAAVATHSGTILIGYNSKVIDGGMLDLTGTFDNDSGSITWTCGTFENPNPTNQLPNKWLPANCRK